MGGWDQRESGWSVWGQVGDRMEGEHNETGILMGGAFGAREKPNARETPRNPQG